MKPSRLFNEVRYAGKAQGQRLTYHVFQAREAYLLLAPNSRGGYTLNPVDARVLDVIARKFKGRQITARALKEKARRPDLFGKPFAALNALYVMVGLGRARKLNKMEGRAQVFKIA